MRPCPPQCASQGPGGSSHPLVRQLRSQGFLVRPPCWALLRCHRVGRPCGLPACQMISLAFRTTEIDGKCYGNDEECRKVTFDYDMVAGPLKKKEKGVEKGVLQNDPPPASHSAGEGSTRTSSSSSSTWHQSTWTRRGVLEVRLLGACD